MPRRVASIAFASFLLAGGAFMEGCTALGPGNAADYSPPRKVSLGQIVQSRWGSKPTANVAVSHPTANTKTASASSESAKPGDNYIPPTLRDWAKEQGGAVEQDSDASALNVNLAETGTTDDDLAKLLHDRVQIQKLDLTSTDITDAGLTTIARLEALKVIRLDDTEISESGAAQLVKLTTLEFIGLSSTDTSDASLKDFAHLASLRFLLLDSTRVTDAGLKHLEQCKKLEGVSLTGTQVTEAGVRALESALPQCVVLWQTTNEEKSTPEIPQTSLPHSSDVPVWARTPEDAPQTAATSEPDISDDIPVFSLDGDWSSSTPAGESFAANDSPAVPGESADPFLFVSKPTDPDLNISSDNTSSVQDADPFAPFPEIADPVSALPSGPAIVPGTAQENLGTWTSAVKQPAAGMPQVTPLTTTRRTLADSGRGEKAIVWSASRGQFAMVQRESGHIMVFPAAHAANGILLEGPFKPVQQLQFMNGDRTLLAITVSKDGLRPSWDAVQWDVATGQRIASLFLGEDVSSITIVPDSSMIVIGRSSGEQQVVDLSGNRTTVSNRLLLNQESTGWRTTRGNR